MIDYPASDATRDAVLEWVARELEEGDFRDIMGVMARRKRDREDAQLRSRARVEMRQEFADYLRAMVGRDDLSAVSVLRNIAELDPTADHVVELRHAWPLAWKGWLNIECILTTNCNQIPPAARYLITLTERGRAMLQAQTPATGESDSGSTQKQPEPDHD